ncbi:MULTISPECIES: restriction endonuclease [Microbacterium]|jgi:restriction system protein|uniref:Restriction endonuclease n=1 Tax=Microbacterium flavum TaxID=415216 RepID=A0ABS5XUQ3_9MICO|nr:MULTISPECIES: restriction endonuclease [Microbacterium]MBT8797889.1 restriction endonuclease [Microbacterium flavum]MCX6503228.1 restriction endonuclease [Microbacterium sp.]
MTVPLPKFSDLLLPTLKAVAHLGGSGSISEIVSMVIKLEQFTEAQQDVLHNEGPETKIGYRVAWARTYLKYFGLLTNSARGVWAITEAGDQFLTNPTVTDSQRVAELFRMKAEKIKEAALERAARGEPLPTGAPLVGNDDEPDESLEAAPSASWKERVISVLTSDAFSPTQFERLAQRLLREADFESVTVTGRSGDQGIDGIGIYRLGLLSFPVYFQCKRYKGSVGAGDVRDFRGALQGRGEKGLLITTGAFTAAAKAEASRDGATPVDLIDGDRLCELLLRYELGVSARIVEEIWVNPEFFVEI